MENEETEKAQLDEALKRVGDKLRDQSREYTEFKKMTTDTPRTDACPLCASTDDCMCFSEELKQALAASNAEVERLTKRPFGCKCETLREKVLGDGCDECNKAFVIEMLTDERDELEAEVESLNSRMVELKHKQASLIAAINTAITEFPSNQASIYLSGIMEKLFQK